MNRMSNKAVENRMHMLAVAVEVKVGREKTGVFFFFFIFIIYKFIVNFIDCNAANRYYIDFRLWSSYLINKRDSSSISYKPLQAKLCCMTNDTNN